MMIGGKTRLIHELVEQELKPFNTKYVVYYPVSQDEDEHKRNYELAKALLSRVEKYGIDEDVRETLEAMGPGWEIQEIDA